MIFHPAPSGIFCGKYVMSREHDGWCRKLWEDDSGDYVSGLNLECAVQQLIGGDLAGQHFSVETIAELLEQREGVTLNPRTLRQFVNGLVGTGEVVIVSDGRGNGGRVYRSCSTLSLPTLNETDIADELKWSRTMADFREACHVSGTRSIKARRVG